MQLEEGEVIANSSSPQPLFTDCSTVLRCCPCNDCSLRAFLRKICPNFVSVLSSYFDFCSIIVMLLFLRFSHIGSIIEKKVFYFKSPRNF